MFKVEEGELLDECFVVVDSVWFNEVFITGCEVFEWRE